MPPDPCPDCQKLQRFLVGLTSESDAEALEAHLAACSRCLQAAHTLTPPDTLIELAQTGARTPGPVRVEVDPRLVEWFCGLPGLVAESGPTPPAEGPAGAEERYEFLAPAERPDEMGRLGPYRVLKVLGSGGMGVVFLAEDLHLRRRVALGIVSRRNWWT